MNNPDFVDKNGQQLTLILYRTQELPVNLHPAQQILKQLVHKHLIAHAPLMPYKYELHCSTTD